MAKYLRNRRPNRFNVRVEGLSLQLERRGHRADSVSIPDSAFKSVGIARSIRDGYLEEIKEDEFFTLQARDVEDEPEQVQRIKGSDPQGDALSIPGGPNARYVLPEFIVEGASNLAEADPELNLRLPGKEEMGELKRRAREIMSPKLQYEGDPETTADEVARIKSKFEVDDSGSPEEKIVHGKPKGHKEDCGCPVCSRVASSA